MSEKIIPEVAVVGIDIGKTSFHVIGLDRRGAVVLQQRWSRSQIEARFANMPSCLVGMEAWKPPPSKHSTHLILRSGRFYDRCRRGRRPSQPGSCSDLGSAVGL